MTSPTDDCVVRLLRTARQAREVGQLTELLSIVAQALSARACSLWELAPTSEDISSSGPFSMEPRLLARWSSEVELQEALPSRHIAGQAIANKDSFADAGVCAAPLLFEDGTLGAVSVERPEPMTFSDAELTSLRALAALLPGLHETVQDRINLTVLDELGELLTASEASASEHDQLAESQRNEQQQAQTVNSSVPGVTDNSMRATLKSVCQTIGTALNAFEVDVLLENPLEQAGQYTLWASYRRSPDPNDLKVFFQHFEPLRNAVLEASAPLQVGNVFSFASVARRVRKTHATANFEVKAAFEAACRSAAARLGSGGNPIPSVGFMASPMLHGRGIVGLIQASSMTLEASAFGRHELRLLRQVCAQLGRFVGNWRARRQVEEENQSWLRLLTGITHVNRFVQEQITAQQTDFRPTFSKVLQETFGVFRDTYATDVRLYDEGTKDLYFDLTHGDAWNGGDAQDQETRRQLRYPIKDNSSVYGWEPASVGELAYVYKCTHVVVKGAKNQRYYNHPVFPETTWLVVAPILLADQRIGVLDFRGSGAYRQYTRDIVALLGHLLGLYHYLFATIGKLVAKDLELVDQNKAEKRTMENLEHQLQGPLRQLVIRVDALVQDAQPHDQDFVGLRTTLLRFRGLSRRAYRVAMSTKLFSTLERRRPIRVDAKALEEDALVRALVGAKMDEELAMDPARKLRFVLEDESFRAVRSHRVLVDSELLAQAMSCLLDNAHKYSFDDTSVTIRGGLIERGSWFQISVTNTGLRLDRDELGVAIQRGWRGELAKDVQGSGSGIGLWIVDHIMKAHGGRLRIAPTNPENITTFELLFPVEK